MSSSMTLPTTPVTFGPFVFDPEQPAAPPRRCGAPAPAAGARRSRAPARARRRRRPAAGAHRQRLEGRVRHRHVPGRGSQLSAPGARRRSAGPDLHPDRPSARLPVRGAVSERRPRRPRDPRALPERSESRPEHVSAPVRPSIASGSCPVEHSAAYCAVARRQRPSGMPRPRGRSPTLQWSRIPMELVARHTFRRPRAPALALSPERPRAAWSACEGCSCRLYLRDRSTIDSGDSAPGHGRSGSAVLLAGWALDRILRGWATEKGRLWPAALAGHARPMRRRPLRRGLDAERPRSSSRRRRRWAAARSSGSGGDVES